VHALSQLAFRDLVDVAIVALLLWAMLVWLRGTRARLALVGLGIVLGLYLLAQQIELQLTVWLFQGFFAVVVLVMIVVFQDDLRRLFERIAVTGLRPRRARPGPWAVGVVSRAVEILARNRVGALVVVPGRDPLDRHLEGGVHLRGRVSEELLQSLFDPHSAGHDGAVVLEGNEIARFAVHLPLCTDPGARGPGGTRHAAALGLTERSDALCIVVSEERGSVSLARDGRLREIDAPEALDAALYAFVRASNPPRREAGLARLLRDVPSRWREGLAAGALALAMWAVLVPGDAVVKMAFAVPVSVENLPEGWDLDDVEPQEVEITLAGHRRDVDLASPANVRVRIDGLPVQLGRRTFEISAQLVEHPSELRVVAVAPHTVRLRVSREQGSG
jgi:uncharacterized protein (TIGR00159 family)